MSLKSFLTGKNLLVSLGLLGVGIVVLKMLTGNIPPSRPPASKVMAQGGGGYGYFDVGNLVSNDDIPVTDIGAFIPGTQLGVGGQNWGYTTQEKVPVFMSPGVTNMEGNTFTPTVMNAYPGFARGPPPGLPNGPPEVHGNRPDIEDFPGQGYHYGWDKDRDNRIFKGQGHHYGWDKRPANAMYTRSHRILSY